MSESSTLPAAATIGWLVNVADFDSASVRYRCAHPLANLVFRGLGGRVYTKVDRLSADLSQLDGIVIVKRIDPGLVALVSAARDAGVPVWLDLCDDLVSPDGRSELREMAHAVLRALAPLLEGIWCPTPKMRARVHAYLKADHQGSVPIEVLPDCVETLETYSVSRSVWERVVGHGNGAKAAKPPPVVLQPDPGAIQLLWFGNWGGPHSDFGIMSLLPALHRLAEYEHRDDLSLHVVSNHEALGEVLRQHAPVRVTYHPWSRDRVAALLDRTHFTLVTSGDDAFSAIKSPNRTLLSLASGVPVISEPGVEGDGSLAKGGIETVSIDRMTQVFADVRREGYSAVRERLLAGVWPALEPFGMGRIGARYAERLRAGMDAARRRPRAVRRLAHVFGLDEDLGLALDIREACRAAGIDFIAIAGLQALQRRPALATFFGHHGIKPSVVCEEEAAADDARRLRGADLVVQATAPASPLGSLLQGWRAARGVPVMSQGEYLYRHRQPSP